MMASAEPRGARPRPRGRIERIAHDLNNLLTAIVGHCDLLDRGAAAPQDAVRAIRAAAEAMGALADELAAVSADPRHRLQ